jgi:diaminohydroxyphosphoribosylaminopyrimidine deaminase / 5-amino-6-(5-phosphoribosylamino)uracil reductase
MSGQDRDAFFMRKALRLAERGRGQTSPNPLVGALVVDTDGVVVGRGSHEFAGGPHAEVHALRDAGARARGATLYCTLEPCTHVGRTGPCAPLVAESGIARAVIATQDPNPVAGGGIAVLLSRGLQVSTGVLADAARRLNDPFFSLVLRRRPFVTMKVAVSLDGMIAGPGGATVALTGPHANRLVHRDRAEVDAIAVGSGTVLLDDPVLTPRVAYRRRPLTRIVYDTRLRTPPSARLFSTLSAGPVIIVTTADAAKNAARCAEALRGVGAELITLDGERSVISSLQALAQRGVSSLLVEGGTQLHRAFWDARAVDRVQMYVADRLVGDGGIEWLQEPVMSAGDLTNRSARPVGVDVLLEAYVHRPD